MEFEIRIEDSTGSQQLLHATRSDIKSLSEAVTAIEQLQAEAGGVLTGVVKQTELEKPLKKVKAPKLDSDSEEGESVED